MTTPSRKLSATDALPARAAVLVPAAPPPATPAAAEEAPPVPARADAPPRRAVLVELGPARAPSPLGPRPKDAMKLEDVMANDNDQGGAGPSRPAGPAPVGSSLGPQQGPAAGPQPRDVPIDWEALEDAFENNAPEVHSYLHLGTGDVLRVVDGVADPQMHARIAADSNYLRIDPVSSREQYRWMERYIPMVEDLDLQQKLTQAIDGKGAFRRFKDVLMNYGPERERWFSFRSERLRIFMEAWLGAHALSPIVRPVWVPDAPPSREGDAAPSVVPPPREESKDGRRGRSAESIRKAVREIADALGPRDLDTLVAFAEFLKARRAARSFAQHNEPRDPAAEDEVPASQERAGAETRPTG